MSPFTLAYSDIGDITLAQGWDDNIFQNNNGACGAVSDCYLLESNCLDELKSTNVYLYGPEWQIRAKRNVRQGWQLDFCYKCVSEN